MSEWIPCSERLPKSGDYIIMFCRTDKKSLWHVEPGIFLVNDRFIETEDDKSFSWAYIFEFQKGYSFSIEVSHWMPLPKPPKREEK